MSWDLTGNAGTTQSPPNPNFLGTTDYQPLVIRTNASERMRITPDGSIGMGTTTPRNALGIRAIGVAQELISFEDSTGTTRWHINQNLGGNNPGLNFVETGVADGRLFIRAGGNVGIGTTKPITALHLPEQGLQIGFSDTATDNFHWTSDIVGGTRGFRLWNGNYGNGNLLLTVLSSGDVGIGTLQPMAKLEVDGNVAVTGDILLTGADCAEEFDIVEAVNIEPGMVLVIDQDGELKHCHQPYDSRVAGVVSGAGEYKAGLILDRQQSGGRRLPVALVGKVYCKVDAEYSSIEVGDLLTTSPTPGHAMKASDPIKAFGSVIGKALRPLRTGQGMIPILIALQ